MGSLRISIYYLVHCTQVSFPLDQQDGQCILLREYTQQQSRVAVLSTHNNTNSVMQQRYSIICHSIRHFTHLIDRTQIDSFGLHQLRYHRLVSSQYAQHQRSVAFL
jgi:hypothetical protein